MKKIKKFCFIGPSSPEGIRRQRESIKKYYSEKRKNKSSIKTGKFLPFLDLESKVQETLKKEDQEIKCSQCPEYEACISGEPLAIPCPLERSKDVK